MGCLPSASARVLPASTSMHHAAGDVLELGVARSAPARMLSDCTSGRPELIIVANCRVKMTTSRVLIDRPGSDSLISLRRLAQRHQQQPVLAQVPDDLVAGGRVEVALHDLARGGVLGGVFKDRHRFPRCSSTGPPAARHANSGRSVGRPGPPTAGSSDAASRTSAIACSSTGVSPIDRRNSDGLGDTRTHSSLDTSRRHVQPGRARRSSSACRASCRPASASRSGGPCRRGSPPGSPASRS